MKSLFYLIILLAYCLPIQAQKLRYTDTTNEWYYFNTKITRSSGMGIYDTTIIHEKHTGTKLINNKVYIKKESATKIKRYTSLGYDQEGTYYYDTFALYTSYFRENNNRLYYLPTDTSTTEILIFDFNSTLGDTVVSKSEGTYVVTSVDTLILNGIKHRHYILKGVKTIYSIDKEIVEGIGVVYSSYVMEKVSSRSDMICFKNEGANTYTHPNSLNCSDAAILISNNNGINSLKIYPQPANDAVNITLPENCTEIVVYNTVGLKVFKKQLNNDNTIQIDNFSPGIYYYIISTNNNKIYNGKIVFQ